MKLFFVSLLLNSMVVGTWAIDCYSCQGGACDDPFIPTSSSNTCSTSGYCLKAVAGSIVTRSCTPVCDVGCADGLCCCNSNLCNGGTTVTTSLVAMGVAMLAAFILARQ